MFAKTSLLFVASMAAAAVAHSPVGVQRRELVYRLRQMSERAEIYPATSVPQQVLEPSIEPGYDTVDGNGNVISCGPGRTLLQSGQCQISVTSPPEFAISPVLTEPQPVAVPITWANRVVGPTSVMNVFLCSSICTADSGCTGLYYSEDQNTQTGSCWKLGADGTYPSTDDIPFTPTGAGRMVKRAPGVTGEFLPGGQVAISLAPVDGNASAGCLTDFGDAPQEDLSCVCGAGRVNTAVNVCAFAATNAGRMSRKMKRDVYGGVPW